MAKKKTEIITEEIVETPAVEEAPKKKRGRPRKNPELSNEIKETADKVVEEIKETKNEEKVNASHSYPGCISPNLVVYIFKLSSLLLDSNSG